MVKHKSLAAMVFGLLGLAMSGCANNSGAMSSNLAANNVKSADATVGTDHNSSAVRAQAPKPQPAPALLIPGPPPAPPAPFEVQLQEPAPRDVPAIPTGMQHVSPPPAPVVTAPAAPAALPDSLQRPAQGLAALESMRELQRRANQRYATMDCYWMRLRRREVVGKSKRPEEVMICKIRKEPFSVFMRWISEEGKNREVVYVKNRYDNLIHTLTARGDIPLTPGGQKISVAPDSILVRSKSRYPITEAGIGPLLVRFGSLADSVQRGDGSQGTVQYMGLQKRPEFEKPLAAVLQVVPARLDPNLPGGGQRWWFFDVLSADSGRQPLNLPVLIITVDEAGREVEYYCHERIITDAHFRDDDFDPAKLWPGR